ncbi:MAG: DUF115 domain-containing protein [Syntrophomonas sp.]|nr:DUF115 domain-containing protein [Syntrophomonas sp.]
MGFIENMEILRELFPDTWKKISEIEDKLDKDLVRTIPTKDGSSIFKVGKQFIHDKKAPHSEAENMIIQFKNIKDHSDILFYGLGMGYHINAFVEQYPGTSFSIYEPAPEVFYQFLCHADLKQMPLHLLKNIYIETRPEDPNIFCGRYVRNISNSVLVIELPAYRSIFPEKHKNFFAEFEKQINERRISVATNSTFQKRWTINSIRNFIQVLKSPNIMIEKKAYFNNKPAILVAAGPSLEEEIENLRTIKKNGLAYIFSVGTAINSLIQRQVYPHAACTYDPSEENQIFCKEVLEKNINSIPLIFGSTVGYETLEKYPGPKSHMLISQDSLAAFYLNAGNHENVDSVNDATTIAVITLQLLYKLGFNPIILVGQNLAYRDGKNYTSGSTYPAQEAIQQEMNNAVLVKDVYGNEVPSNHNYIRMKQQLEIYISHYKDLDIINTTQYGAHIEGTRFETLDTIINAQLHNRVVEDEWLESEKLSYDMEYLIKQNRIMNDAHQKVIQLLEICKLDLDNICQLSDSGNVNLIGRSYEQFNLSMDELRNNQFFITFITPMNRVELEFLILTVSDISRETDPILKAKLMEKHFRPFLLNCEQDILLISPFFKEMNQSIQDIYKLCMVRQKAARTKILLVDSDGVLTDGNIYYSASGDEIRKFHYKDRIGIDLLKAKGFIILIINQESNPVIKTAAEKLGIHPINSEDKTGIIAEVAKEYALDHSEIACVFNDMCDLESFKQVGLSFAVQNAAQDLHNAVDYVLAVNGGQGAMLEIAKLLAD